MPFAFLAPARPRRFAEDDAAPDDLAASVEPDETTLRRAFLAAVAALLLLLDSADGETSVTNALVIDLMREFERGLTAKATPGLVAAFVQGATWGRDRLPVASVGLSFDLVNELAVLWADTHASAMVTGISDQTRQAIRSIITRSVRDGLSPAQVAREIRALIGLTERDALAVGNLQTALLEDGRKPEQVERMVARYANRLLRRRAETIARTECLPGETPIDAAMVSAIHRRWYEGPIVQITTAHGRHFSATPNHPMLTNRGWLPMEAISQGDYLVSHDRQQSAGAPGDQNVQATPPTIAEIFDALSAVWISERKRGRKPDFHGDGMEGNVDTLRSDRMLAVGRFSPLYEPVVKRLLAVADLARAPFCHVCSRLLSIDQQPCLCRAPSLDTDLIKATPYQALRDFQRLGDGGNRFTAHEALSDGLAVNVGTVVRGVSTPTDERTPGVASGPRFPGRAEYASDPLRVSGHRLGDHRDTQSASVQLDRVTSILFRSWSGHVYNLSTPYGYFAANEVYTGNTMTAANRGQEALWSQAVADGLLAEADWERMWLVAKDERTCKVCQPLDRKRAPMLGGTFPGGVAGPPIHPRCRCATGLIEKRGAT